MRFFGLIGLSFVTLIAVGCSGGTPSGLGPTGGSSGGTVTTVFTEDFAAFTTPAVWTSTGTVPTIDNATGNAVPSLNVPPGSTATTAQAFNIGGGATALVNVVTLAGTTSGTAQILILDPANTVIASASVDPNLPGVNYSVGGNLFANGFAPDGLFHEYRLVISGGNGQWFRDGVAQAPASAMPAAASLRVRLSTVGGVGGFRYDRIRVTNP
jgi:hypothetical protein